MNGTLHGMYAKALLPEEREIFNSLAADDAGSLLPEITLLRTKVVTYLTQVYTKYEEDREKYGEAKAYSMSKVYYSESENGARSYYHAGTLEDRALDRTLSRIRHLVETHNRLKGDDEESDMMDSINAELRAASRGHVSISWGDKAQSTAEM